MSASLRKEADFVSMPLSIKSDHKDPSKRLEIIGRAKAALLKAVDGKMGRRRISSRVLLKI